MRAALAELGVDFDRLRELEPDAALGNGGLGRLAACFMESMATLRHRRARLRHPLRPRHVPPGHPGRLAAGVSRELAGLRQSVGIRAARRDTHRSASAARVETQCDADGTDDAAPGTRRDACEPSPTTRRWSAGAATTSTRCASGRRGQRNRCGSTRSTAATMSARWRRARGPRRSRRCSIRATKPPPGQELRLRQEYFFTSASLQDLVGRHMRQHGDIRTLPDKAAIQLNDTHPAIAVAELMRLLVDVHEVPWDEAWRITTDTIVLHQPHAAARGAGELAGVADGAAAAAPHADHLPDQSLASRCRLRTSARTDAPPLAAVSLIDDAGGRRVRMGHSPSSARTRSTASPRCTPS